MPFNICNSEIFMQMKSRNLPAFYFKKRENLVRFATERQVFELLLFLIRVIIILRIRL